MRPSKWPLCVSRRLVDNSGHLVYDSLTTRSLNIRLFDHLAMVTTTRIVIVITRPWQPLHVWLLDHSVTQHTHFWSLGHGDNHSEYVANIYSAVAATRHMAPWPLGHSAYGLLITRPWWHHSEYDSNHSAVWQPLFCTGVPYDGHSAIMVVQSLYGLISRWSINSTIRIIIQSTRH